LLTTSAVTLDAVRVHQPLDVQRLRAPRAARTRLFGSFTYPTWPRCGGANWSTHCRARSSLSQSRLSPCPVIA